MCETNIVVILHDQTPQHRGRRIFSLLDHRIVIIVFKCTSPPLRFASFPSSSSLSSFFSRHHESEILEIVFPRWSESGRFFLFVTRRLTQKKEGEEENFLHFFHIFS